MKKKFTIIELLVVVAVIALLLSILLPSLTKAREAGKRAVCKSNLAQIYRTILLYSKNENGRIALGTKSNMKYQGNFFFAPKHTGLEDAEKYSYFHYYNAGYVGDPQVWYCPSAAHNNSFAFNGSNNKWPPETPGTRSRAAYNHKGQFLGADNETNPLLIKLEDQVIMSDIVSQSKNINNTHAKGVNVSSIDGRTGWVPYSVFKSYTDTFTKYAKSNNSNWLEMYDKFKVHLN